MNLLALALLQSISFGVPVAQPPVPAIVVAPRAAAVEAVVVAPTLDAQAQLVSGASVVSAADEYPSAWPRLFEGRATGKYYGARYYSSGQGRFVSPDPAFTFKDLIPEPQLWNRYAYVGNQPLSYIDPDGRERAGLLLDRDIKDLASGKISVDEYNARLQARGAGAVAGLGAVVGGWAAANARALWGAATTFLYTHPEAPGQIVEALGPPGSPSIVGLYGRVARSELETLAAAGGSTIQVATRLTSAPEAGRALSVAAGDGAQALASAARSGGNVYGAQIPKALLAALEKAGLAQRSTTLMNGVKGVEYRFLPQATEFITKFFNEM